MTYTSLKTNNAQIDNDIKAARQDISKFHINSIRHAKQLGRVIDEAVKQKYHAGSKKACPLFANFRKSGFSDVAADSMCRQAHKYGINPNLSPGTILGYSKREPHNS